MSKASALSGEEVSALMDGVDEGQSAGGRAAPKPFTFGSEAMRPMSAMPALDRMGERMARKLRDAIEPMARIKPKIGCEPLDIRRFESWRAAKPEYISLSLYRFRPLKGGLLIAVDPALIGRLVDTFYGGSGNAASSRKEFTPTEERLLGRLTEVVVATLTEVWAEVMPLQLQLSGRETNIAYATLVRAEEPVAVARFTVAFGIGEPSVIEILYPVSALRTVEAELSARAHEDGGVAGAEWRSQLAAALGEVRVEARSVLARPTLSVLELLRLAPGDVIPISLPALVPLLIGGRTIALGTIGEQDGHAALKVEKIEDRSKGQ